MQQHEQVAQQRTTSTALATNKVIRNTYSLLSLTLLFSALCAGVAMMNNVGRMNIFVFLVGAYGLLFLTAKLRNSVWGLPSTFAFTGFMGFSLGPILNAYLSLPNGGEVVMMALGSTGVIFLALSAYALTSRKDFSFLSGFLFAGALVLIGAMLVGWLFDITGLGLAISAGFALFASAAILFETSQLIHGGERNYIMATIGLYVSIYNLLLSLLHLIGAFSGDD